MIYCGAGYIHPDRVALGRPDPEILWWWNGDALPQDPDAYKRAVKWELETESRVIYSDLRPIDVKIHSNTAIISNYGPAGWIDKNGKRILTQDKRLSGFQTKEQGLHLTLPARCIKIVKA